MIRNASRSRAASSTIPAALHVSNDDRKSGVCGLSGLFSGERLEGSASKLSRRSFLKRLGVGLIMTASAVSLSASDIGSRRQLSPDRDTSVQATHSFETWGQIELTFAALNVPYEQLNAFSP
jgi:hypothetical protein